MIGRQHSTLNRLFGCFPGMMSLLAKSTQIMVRTFRRFFLQFSYFFDVRNFVNIQTTSNLL